MDRFPNWARWLLFLPLSIIASIVVFVLVKLATLLFDNFFLFQLLLILPGSGLAGYIFVAGAAFLVPKFKIPISMVMTLGYGLLSYFILFKKAILADLIKLNSFEITCLTVLGTMAAIFASYQNYANQKKIDQELIDLEREKKIKKELERKRKISNQNSDVLEDSILKIINQFDTGAAKPKRNIIEREKVPNRAGIPARSNDLQQHDSIHQINEEDMIISDMDSDELEQEISEVMNVLDTGAAAFEAKSVSKRKFSSHADRGTTHFQEPPVIPTAKRKKRQVPPQVPEELDQKISQVMSEMGTKEKVIQKKAAPKSGLPTRAVEREISSNTFSDGTKDPSIIDKNRESIKVSIKVDEELSSPFSTPGSESDKSKIRELLRKKEEQLLPGSESMDLAGIPLQTQIETNPEIEEPKRKVISNKDQLTQEDGEVKSKDTLRDFRQIQPEHGLDKTKSEKEARIETDVQISDQRKLQEKPLPASVEPGLKINVTQDEVLFKEDQIDNNEKIRKPRDVRTETSLAKELKDQNVVAKRDSLNSEKRPPKAISKLSKLPDKPEPEQSKTDDVIISLSDLDRLIEHYHDESLTERPAKVEDIPEQDIMKSGESETEKIKEVEPDDQEPQKVHEKFEHDSSEPPKLEETKSDDLSLQEFSEETHFSYLNLENLDESVIQTTTELDILIREAKTNQFMNYVDNYYKSVGEDESVALIHTEIFYLWCMMEAVFEFSMDSEFRQNLIMFFNTRVGELYLKWKELTNSSTMNKISIDFNNFSYYSNQVRTNKIHLNSTFQNTDAEILFGKIVLTKIHECMGNQKVDVERETILMPVQVYYDLRNRVVEILNRTTNMICY